MPQPISNISVLSGNEISDKSSGSISCWEGIAALVSNVDLGVITTPENPTYFRTKLLFKDRYAAAVNSEHRFFERKTVRWEEPAREPFATFEKDSSTHRDTEQTLEIIGVHFAPH